LAWFLMVDTGPTICHTQWYEVKKGSQISGFLGS